MGSNIVVPCPPFKTTGSDSYTLSFGIKFITLLGRGGWGWERRNSHDRMPSGEISTKVVRSNSAHCDRFCDNTILSRIYQ